MFVKAAFIDVAQGFESFGHDANFAALTIGQSNVLGGPVLDIGVVWGPVIPSCPCPFQRLFRVLVRARKRGHIGGGDGETVRRCQIN